MQHPLFKRQLCLVQSWVQSCQGSEGWVPNATLLLVHFFNSLRILSITIPEKTGERLSREQLRKGSQFVFCLSFLLFSFLHSSLLGPGSFECFLRKILAFPALWERVKFGFAVASVGNSSCGTGWLTSYALGPGFLRHLLQALSMSLLSCIWIASRCHLLGCVWTRWSPGCAHLHSLMAPICPSRPWG